MSSVQFGRRLFSTHRGLAVRACRREAFRTSRAVVRPGATSTATRARGGQITLARRGLVQANGGSNEGRESLLIDFIVLVEVDCAPGVAFEA
jgi:hypothetical protein